MQVIKIADFICKGWSKLVCERIESSPQPGAHLPGFAPMLTQSSLSSEHTGRIQMFRLIRGNTALTNHLRNPLSQFIKCNSLCVIELSNATESFKKGKTEPHWAKQEVKHRADMQKYRAIKEWWCSGAGNWHLRAASIINMTKIKEMWHNRGQHRNKRK